MHIAPPPSELQLTSPSLWCVANGFRDLRECNNIVRRIHALTLCIRVVLLRSNTLHATLAYNMKAFDRKQGLHKFNGWREQGSGAELIAGPRLQAGWPPLLKTGRDSGVIYGIYYPLLVVWWPEAKISQNSLSEMGLNGDSIE
jgi:hypothetical protein